MLESKHTFEFLSGGATSSFYAILVQLQLVLNRPDSDPQTCRACNWDAGVARQIGAFADRLVLETNPAVQARFAWEILISFSTARTA
jgi:hypothetical protein